MSKKFKATIKTLSDKNWRCFRNDLKSVGVKIRYDHPVVYFASEEDMIMSKLMFPCVWKDMNV